MTSRIEQRLIGLMFARLVLSLVIFGVAFGMDALGRSLAPEAVQGLYWTLGFAFLMTAISAVAVRRVKSAARFGAVQVATDTLLATGLVALSGGIDSVFTFLYVVVPVYSAVIFGHRGAFGAATLCALGVGGIAIATHTGRLDSLGAVAEPLPILLALWGIHVGALYLVGALASVLSGELHRTGEALDQRTGDLRRLQHLHERTVKSLMSGLLTTGTEGRITSFNPEAVRITGAAATSAVGIDIEELIPGARQILGEAQAGTLAPATLRARLPYRNCAGADLHLGLAGSILRDEDGQALGFVVIFQDVTHVVAMEEELRVSERLAAVGELSAKIAHEIRNPLAAISGAIQILDEARDKVSAVADHGRLMQIVVRETDRLNLLITDFLHYARPRPTVLRRVPIKSLIDDLIEVFDSSRPENVNVSTEGIEPIAAAADADQLSQALWNLVLNAVQSMPDGGTLTLEAHLVEGTTPQGHPVGGRKNAQDPSAREELAPVGLTAPVVEITVRDTGAGIPFEVQERMFEPFFTTRTEGSGLGLSTVHRIVESHGGTLGLESAVGAGTTFRIRLSCWEEVG